MIIDKNKIIQDVNKVSLELLDCSSEAQIRGKQCNKTFCPFVDRTCPVLDLGAEINRAEHVIITKNGTHKPVLRTIVPFTLDGKDVILEAVIDLSEIKMAEQNIIDERNRAELYLDLLGHDVSNITQAILGYNEMLLMKTELPESTRSFVQNSFNMARAMRDLVENVRKLSNLHKGEYKFENIDIKTVLADSTTRCNYANPDRKITVNQRISSDVIIVKANELLNDVSDNIIQNAVKFNRHPDVVIDIECTLIEENSSCKIEFKDYGPGIPDEMKERIFKRTGLDGENIFNTGFGLTFVQEVVSYCNGFVWVEDRVAGDHRQGANLVVVIPLGK